MMEKCDFLAKIMERLRTLHPDLSEEIVQRVEREFRKEYAGSRVYIQKHSAGIRKDAITRMLNGRNIEEVSRKLGIHRATAYRLIKRGK